MLAAGQVRADRGRIGDVARNEFLDVGVPGEIQPLVPRPEARRLRGEPVA
jgi:hypothetical protein